MTRSSPPLRLVGGVVLCGALLSCGGSDATTPGGQDIERVSVTPPSQEVAIDGSVTFTATVTTESGDDATATSPITWSVAPAAVATLVGDGATAIVTGVEEGAATVRATAGGRSGEAALTVVDPDPPAAPSSVTGLAVSDTEIDLAWDDNSDNEDEFRIEREEVVNAAPGDGGPARAFSEVATAGADDTFYRDAGLSPGTSYRYLVRACNRNGCSPIEGDADESAATSAEVATQETLVVQTRSLPPGVQDRAYERKLSAAGGDGAYAWTVSAGVTPAGVDLSGSGVLLGTPTEHGVFEFTVEVRSGEQTATAALVLEIQEEIFPPEVTTTSLPTGVVGRAYEASLEASEGDGQYAFGVVAGSLPPGLTLGEGGSIAGTPSAEGGFTFTVRVTSAEMTGEADLTLDVHDPLAVTTATLPSGVEGRSYEARLVAGGGDGANTWSLTGGALPDGLGLSTDGTIAGTAAAASPRAPGGPLPVTGAFDFSVRVESGDGQAATADLTIEVFEVLEIEMAALPGGEVGTAYSHTVGATGGDGT
ncbi:MAG: putative Ig domain-containing protein, partial [Gemmatimonadota bacterium]